MRVSGLAIASESSCPVVFVSRCRRLAVVVCVVIGVVVVVVGVIGVGGVVAVVDIVLTLSMARPCWRRWRLVAVQFVLSPPCRRRRRHRLAVVDGRAAVGVDTLIARAAQGCASAQSINLLSKAKRKKPASSGLGMNRELTLKHQRQTLPATYADDQADDNHNDNFASPSRMTDRLHHRNASPKHNGGGIHDTCGRSHGEAALQLRDSTTTTTAATMATTTATTAATTATMTAAKTAAKTAMTTAAKTAANGDDATDGGGQ
ncbi:hypothetical protein EDB85DRAFT_1888569 [Lactarius pseudohatsudake]|nr:hypothetical protein EDB85DRAFT_1888569 [Lactarius pseudohatsudake]